MRKRHKFAIGGFGVVTIAFMVIVAFTINGIMIKQSIEKKQFENEINNLEKNLNYKINEIATNIISINEKMNTQISSMSSNLTKIDNRINNLNKENYEDFSSIITQSMPSILNVRTLSSQATGFIIHEEGYFVTNAHLLESPKGDMTQIIQTINHKEEINLAKIIGTSPELDLALLKIEGNFSKLKLANSDALKIGENIIAIGNPQGFTFSVTNGIISATKRIGPNNLPYYIQTNTELNKGNSGGPLINKEGLAVGMNNFKIIDSEGIGFALESNIIKKEVNEIYYSLYNNTLI